MDNTASRLSTPAPGALPWLLAGGLVIGTLDLIFATTFWALHGVPAIRIPQSIAAGVLGRDAYQGGAASAWLGAGLHYFIATMMVAAYFFASRQLPALVRHVLLAGAIYGLFLYFFMQEVVLPLSAAASGKPQDALWVGTSIVAHMLLVGIPAVWFSRRAVAPPR